MINHSCKILHINIIAMVLNRNFQLVKEVRNFPQTQNRQATRLQLSHQTPTCFKVANTLNMSQQLSTENITVDPCSHLRQTKRQRKLLIRVQAPNYYQNLQAKSVLEISHPADCTSTKEHWIRDSIKKVIMPWRLNLTTRTNGAQSFTKIDNTSVAVYLVT